jgi:hypothetical protein
MAWAKIVFATGLLVVFGAFAFGTEHRTSAELMGGTHACGPSISASWFVTGTPSPMLNPGSGASAEERRVAAACGSVIRHSRVSVMLTMGAGGLLALAGWAALHKRPETEPGQISPVIA